VHLLRSRACAWSPRVEETLRARKKFVAKQSQKDYFPTCPISHVPVVVCRSVGIRTRGRTAAKSKGPSISLKRCATRSLLICNRDRQPEANRRTPLSTGDAT